MHWICKQEIIDQPLSVFLLNFHWGATQNVTDRYVWKRNTMLNRYGGWQSSRHTVEMSMIWHAMTLLGGDCDVENIVYAPCSEPILHGIYFKHSQHTYKFIYRCIWMTKFAVNTNNKVPYSSQTRLNTYLRRNLYDGHCWGNYHPVTLTCL